ncbi:MAG: AAA family ATPase [Desulfobulbaceae bacterium]|nr:AAA family ATPase [Desulfobulbaceae bacterium]
MFFTVIPIGHQIPAEASRNAFLLVDGWDDWFAYSTLYNLYIFDNNGQKYRVGGVKIGQFEMKDKQRSPEIPLQFDFLSDEFFSRGQDESYYETLNQLGFEIKELVLLGLHDMGYDQDLFLRALPEKVTGISLLRSVSRKTVKSQFSRLAKGGARLSRYEFVYTTPYEVKSKNEFVKLSFLVEPESMPPTNIHVLIGRNGVGKTHLLNNMTKCLIDKKSRASEVGAFTMLGDTQTDLDIFANLVSVTFSAFDPFLPYPNRRDKSKEMHYSYIGLKRTGVDQDNKALPPKSLEMLSRDFSASVSVCSTGARLSRWRRALEMLEADPNFREAGVVSLADSDLDEETKKNMALKLFGKLSSGHKIVLLTITRLVETVEESTLVLLDEPEAHLHPPLLSAFVRALSDLLIHRNGVAIIATHSPVILQEVPACCVWKIRRSGRSVYIERPEVETFGENVGMLTREVFGLEVTQSGFHRMLYDTTRENDDFESILSQFNGQLGGEARAIVRALLSNQ